MAVLQVEFCAVNIKLAFRAKPNGGYIEVAALQRAGIARVYCNPLLMPLYTARTSGVGLDIDRCIVERS